MNSLRAKLTAYVSCLGLLSLVAGGWCQAPWLSSAYAQQPIGLAGDIDILVRSQAVHPTLIAEPLSDSLQLRRLSLDLRLVTPTAQETDEFLADTRPDRWAHWVQRFLNDSMHRERLVDWLDKTLLQRRPHQHVDRNAWLVYLRRVVDEQKSLDQLLREFVSSSWWNNSQRPAQRFFLERGGDPHAIARDIGRVFFGRDMQCAQCHNHPQIDDYLQIDYHGLVAYVSASSLAEGKYKDEKGAEQKLQLYIERAASDATFESVFDKGVLFRSGPRVLGGLEHFDPYQAPDQRYQPKPAEGAFEGAPNPPVTSRRFGLASELQSSNRAFAENWANRIWALMMGRGIVHPLDMHHAENPPANPELLKRLADALIEHQFQIRPIIEQIAMSETYRRGIQTPMHVQLGDRFEITSAAEGIDGLESYFQSQLDQIKPTVASLHSQLETSKSQLEESEAAWRDAQKSRVVVRAELDKAEGAFTEILKKRDEANLALVKSQKSFDDERTKIQSLDEAVVKLEQAKSLIAGDTNDLVQAIQAAKSRSDAAKKELPNREKAVTDGTALRDGQIALLETERTKVLEIAKRLNDSESQLSAKDAVYVQRRDAWRTLSIQYGYSLRRESTIQNAVQWVVASRTLSQQKFEMSRIGEQIASLQKTILQLQDDVESQKGSIANIEGKGREIVSLQGMQREKMQMIKSQLEQLESAIVALDKTSSLVESKEPLDAAKTSLSQALEPKRSILAMAQQELMLVDQQLQENMALLGTAQTKLQESLGTISRTQTMLADVERNLVHQGELIEQSKEECSRVFAKLREESEATGTIASQRALSPEQLGWSILQATQVLQNYISNEIVTSEKQTPPPADELADQKNVRLLSLTRAALDKLRGNVDVFSNLYASGIGQTMDDFFATPDQALFMSNGGSVFQWAAPSGTNVSGRMVAETDPQNAVRLLYRIVLSREPSANELTWGAEFIAGTGDKKNAVIQELVWATLTSSEFRIYP